MEYKVRLEQLDSRPLAVVRRRATSPELARIVPEACGLVWGVIRARRVEGAGRNVAVYWDDRINLEVGVELEAPFMGSGEAEVVGSATPAGPVATTTHFGPYGGLHQAHRVVLEWCAGHHYELAGPNWEVYGHWTDECNTTPAVIRTDVFYLLKTDRILDGRSRAGQGVQDGSPPGEGRA